MTHGQPNGEDRTNTRPNVFRGAIAGLAGGLAASLAMNLAQTALARLHSTDNEGGGEPATEQAADQIAQTITGAPVPEAAKAKAGQTVHYGFGALLGLGYGVAAEYAPRVAGGKGSAFGLGSALLFDEAAVTAFDLGKSPWETSASTHLYTLVPHLVFGTVTEGTRRLIRPML